MPEIIATGGGSDEDLKQNPLKALWETFSSLDKFSKTLVMTTVLFLVFASAITTITLQTKNYAAQTIGEPPIGPYYLSKTPTKAITPSPTKYLTKTPTPTKGVTNTPSPTKKLTPTIYKTKTPTPSLTKYPTPTYNPTRTPTPH